MSSNNSIQSILGVNVSARKTTEAKNYEPFKNPIIHKRIDGLEIVPIDTERLWGR